MIVLIPPIYSKEHACRVFGVLQCLQRESKCTTGSTQITSFLHIFLFYFICDKKGSMIQSFEKEANVFFQWIYLWLKVTTKYMLNKSCLLCPWRNHLFSAEFIKAHWLHCVYGDSNVTISRAWLLLLSTALCRSLNTYIFLYVTSAVYQCVCVCVCLSCPKKKKKWATSWIHVRLLAFRSQNYHQY